MAKSAIKIQIPGDEARYIKVRDTVVPFLGEQAAADTAEFYRSLVGVTAPVGTLYTVVPYPEVK